MNTGANDATARVTTAEGTHINVRKDELERYLAANPGAQAEGAEVALEATPEVAPEPEQPARRSRKDSADEA